MDEVGSVDRGAGCLPPAATPAQEWLPPSPFSLVLPTLCGELFYPIDDPAVHDGKIKLLPSSPFSDLITDKISI